MKSIVWAASFLPPGDRIYDIFSRLSQILRSQGMQLVLFSNYDLTGDNIGCTTIKVPFFISEMGAEFSEFYSDEGMPASSAHLKEFVAVDAAWGITGNGAQLQLDVLRAISFWERAFALMQPSVILTWGSSAPLSRVWQSLARRRQRPLFVIERGVFENTLTYSIAGQGALSDFSTTLSMVDPGRDEAELRELWSKITAYYAANADRHYAATNRTIDSNALQSIESLPRPRILYLGSNDPGSCASFNYRDFGDLQAPFVSESEQGLEVTVAALGAMSRFSGSVMYKPHIGTQFTYASGQTPFSVVKFPVQDVYSLIERADVVVTMTSTTSFLAILKGKPTVTLANTQFMGREITYEARSAETLSNALAQAIAREDWDARLARGQQLIAAAFKDVLVGLDDEVPTRYRLADLANLIGRFRYYVSDDFEDVPSRLQSFIDFYRQARGGEMPTSGHFLQRDFQALQDSLSDALRQLEIERKFSKNTEALRRMHRKSIEAMLILAPQLRKPPGSRPWNIETGWKLFKSFLGGGRIGKRRCAIATDLYDLNEYKSVEASGWFDEHWYAATYPEIAHLGIDPLTHFMWVGAYLGYSPSQRFDLKAYCLENPDVVQAGVNPLVHYLSSGRDEGRKVHPAS